jgi:two-component system nitrogen regulation sensor histidine kinase NtrY
MSGSPILALPFKRQWRQTFMAGEGTIPASVEHLEGVASPLLDLTDREFWTGFVVVVLSLISALATYLILTGLTPIAPSD